MRKFLSLLLTIGVIFIVLVLSAEQPDPIMDRQIASVVRVIDGDTIEVLQGDQMGVIRLIGIDTPEWQEPGYETATNFTEDLLPPGTLVFLETDLNDRDRYDRWLRYVWLKPDSTDFKQDSLNGLLLSNHLAEPLWMNGDVKYQNAY